MARARDRLTLGFFQRPITPAAERVGSGSPDAAIDVLTLVLRRKDRPDEPLRQVRYERALLYVGQRRRAPARREFERICAEDPGFEDVAERLGL